VGLWVFGLVLSIHFLQRIVSGLERALGVYLHGLGAALRERQCWLYMLEKVCCRSKYVVMYALSESEQLPHLTFA
jgi:hypothetical protein